MSEWTHGSEREHYHRKRAGLRLRMEDALVAALQQEEAGLFVADDGEDEPISPACRQRVVDHVARLNELLSQRLRRIAELEAEAQQLRSLPPPPPIGAEEIAATQDALENLHAKDEVLRKQLGALISFGLPKAKRAY